MQSYFCHVKSIAAITAKGTSKKMTNRGKNETRRLTDEKRFAVFKYVISGR